MLLRPLLLAILLPATALFAAEEGISFSGVLTNGGKTTVHLGNKATGAAAWVSMGETFGGYVISSFDSKTDTLVLKKDGSTYELKLNSSQIGRAEATISTAASPAQPPPLPTEPAAIQRAVLNNLRQIGAAADQYFLENGVNRTTLADLVGPGKYIKALNSVSGEDYSKLELAQGKELVITIPGGATLTYKQ